jgi:hypothetical protein
MLIRTYRVRGHLAADLDPLGLNNRKLPADLTPEYHGFVGAAIDKKVFLGGTLGLQWATVREIVATLRQNYCGKVGLEYMHISDTEERRFLQDRMEGADKSIDFTPRARRPFWARWFAASSTRSSAARSGSAPSASAWMVAIHDPCPGSGHQVWRPAGRQGDRLRHGPSRPPERSGQRHGQALQGDLPRILGRHGQSGGRGRFG